MSAFCTFAPSEFSIERTSDDDLSYDLGKHQNSSSGSVRCKLDDQIFENQEHLNTFGDADNDVYNDVGSHHLMENQCRAGVDRECSDCDDEYDDDNHDDDSISSDEIFVHGSILKGEKRHRKRNAKKVTFNPKTIVVLITCNAEYSELNLKEVLWYRGVDYLLFKAAARLVLESPFREYYNQY